MECITTTSLSILVNGIPEDHFRLERGNRLVDPISLYFCIIYVEYLGRYTNFTSNCPI